MFNLRLKKFRNELGLLNKEMAEKLDIQKSYYSMLESGSREPSKTILNKLVALSGKHEDYWLRGATDEDYINNRDEFKSVKTALNQAKEIGLINDIDDLKKLVDNKVEKGSFAEVLLLAVISDFGYILNQKNNKN